MKLRKKEVEKIAGLARLGLAEEEKDKFGDQLSSILDYVNKLNEVDTDEVPPTAQVTGLEDVSRPDRISSCDSETMKKLIESAPLNEGGYIKVKGVFE